MPPACPTVAAAVSVEITCETVCGLKSYWSNGGGGLIDCKYFSGDDERPFQKDDSADVNVAEEEDDNEDANSAGPAVDSVSAGKDSPKFVPDGGCLIDGGC